MSAQEQAPDELTCATCGAAIEPRPGNRFYPFCSKRCRQVDLGRWLQEDYRVRVTPGRTARAWPQGSAPEDEER